MSTQQPVPSQTNDPATFAAMVKAFGAGEQLACVECGAAVVRTFYLFTETGAFLWGCVLCDLHYQEACKEVDARLTHPVQEIRSLREAANN